MNFIGDGPNSSFRLCRFELERLMTALVAASGPWETVDVRLYADGPAPGFAADWADYNESAFGGYVAATGIAPSLQYADTLGVAVALEDPSLVFVADGTTPETVKGYAVTQGTTPIRLIGAQDFPSPAAMQNAGDAIVLMGALRLSSQQP